jgi:hypothetical protein
MDQGTPESSPQLHHQKLANIIDSQIKIALSFTNSSGWLDLIVNNRQRVLAERIVKTVDWSWTLKMKQQPLVAYLPLYQLFLLCKFESEDFQPSPDTNRLQLSPSPMIDQLWHAHMLHPGKYLEMHTKLGFVDTGKLPRVLEHQPEAVDDSHEMKTNRMASLLGLMLYICPSLSSHVLNPATPSAFSMISERSTQQRIETETMMVRAVCYFIPKTFYFKIGPSTQLMRLADHIAQSTGIPASQLYLFNEGQRLIHSNTAGEEGVLDGDQLDVLQEQRGC